MKQNEPTHLEKAEGPQDLSMEEILASIRRIVTEEPSAVQQPSSASSAYELTQMVTEDGAVIDVRAAAAVQTAAQSQLRTSPAGPKANTSIQQGRNEMNQLSKNVMDTSMASSLAESIAQQLFKLNQASNQIQQAYANGPGGITLENLSRDIIRPYLHDWLDKNFEDLVTRLMKKWLEKNLPELVERVVNEEIRKLTLTDEEI